MVRVYIYQSSSFQKLHKILNGTQNQYYPCKVIASVYSEDAKLEW